MFTIFNLIHGTPGDKRPEPYHSPHKFYLFPQHYEPGQRYHTPTRSPYFTSLPHTQPIPKNKNPWGRNGFTMIELLCVIAFLAIILSISIIGVSKYSDKVKQQTNDDMAREIYYIAQNSLTEAKGNGTLGAFCTALQSNNPHAYEQTSSGEFTESPELYYISASEAYGNSAIGGDRIRNVVGQGSIYIEVGGYTGSVFSVFYSSDGTKTYNEMYAHRYDERRDFGYYEGVMTDATEFAEKKDSSAATLCAAFHNNEELFLEITGNILVDENLSYEKVTLIFTDESNGKIKKEIKFSDYSNAVLGETKDGIWLKYDAIGNYTICVLMDSPDYKFSSLFPELKAGDNISVEIRAEAYDGSGKFLHKETNTAMTNSLFEYSSGGEVGVSCVRHLMNIDDADRSLKVKQTADIDCNAGRGYWTGLEYSETSHVLNIDYDSPVCSYAIQYEGNDNSIDSLSTDGAGLFDTLVSGSSVKNCILNNISIITNSVYAGGIVGKATDTSFELCQVLYGAIKSSGVAGGLAGELSGGTVKECCNAVQEIEGDGYVGGLIGRTENVTVSNSYSSCTTLTGSSAGGLIGDDNAGRISLSYAVTEDFSVSNTAAGFVGSVSANTTINNCYSLIGSVGTTSSGLTRYGFAGSASASCTDNYYYVAGDYEVSGLAECATEANDTESIATALLSSSWSRDSEDKTTYSHPFSVSGDYSYMDGKAYTVLRIPILHHYGNWPDEKVIVSGSTILVFMKNDNLTVLKKVGITEGDTSLEVPTAQTNYGYTFNGWMLSNGITIINTSKNLVKNVSGYTDASGAWISEEDSVDIFPKWTEHHYSVVYNANDGTGTMADSYVLYSQTFNLSTNTFTRDGFDFVGWAKTPTGTKAYEDGESVTKLTSIDNEKVNLYALWAANRYTVYFYKNDGSDVYVTKTVGNSDSFTMLDTSAFTRTGYKITGWAETPTGISKYAPESSASGLSTDGTPITLYAVWSPISYSVRLKANGGTGDDTVINATYGTNITLPAIPFTKTGYTFTGWAESADGSVVYLNKTTVSNLSDTEDSEKILYAKWAPISYSVKFSGNGSSSGTMSNQIFTYDTAAQLSDCLFKKDGYVFLGWSDTEGGDVKYTNQQSVSNLSSVSGKVVNLYAVWKQVVFTVTLDANGGTGSGTAKVTVGKSTVTSTCGLPVRAGYQFEGWDAKDGTEVMYYDVATGQPQLTDIVSEYIADTGNWKYEGNVTLYAKWKEISYTVKFISEDATNGTVLQTFTVKYGNTPSINPTEPKKTGYKFLGWDTNLLSDSDVVGTAYSLSSYVDSNGKWNYAGDVTCHARWKSVTYNISLSGNGGSPSSQNLTVIYGQNTVSGYTKATKSGYMLTGWALSDGTKLLSSAGVLIPNVSGYTDAEGNWIKEDGACVNAVWDEIKTYTLTLKSGDSRVWSYKDPKVSSSILSGYIKPEHRPSTGYTLDGWYTNQPTYDDSTDANHNGIKVLDANGKIVAAVAGITHYTGSGYEFNLDSDITLYARWAVEKSVFVETDDFSHGGDFIIAMSNTAGETIAFSVNSGGSFAPLKVKVNKALSDTSAYIETTAGAVVWYATGTSGTTLYNSFNSKKLGHEYTRKTSSYSLTSAKSSSDWYYNCSSHKFCFGSSSSSSAFIKYDADSLSFVVSTSWTGTTNEKFYLYQRKDSYTYTFNDSGFVLNLVDAVLGSESCTYAAYFRPADISGYCTLIGWVAETNTIGTSAPKLILNADGSYADGVTQADIEALGENEATLYACWYMNDMYEHVTALSAGKFVILSRESDAYWALGTNSVYNIIYLGLSDYSLDMKKEIAGTDYVSALPSKIITWDVSATGSSWYIKNGSKYLYYSSGRLRLGSTKKTWTYTASSMKLASGSQYCYYAKNNNYFSVTSTSILATSDKMYLYKSIGARYVS